MTLSTPGGGVYHCTFFKTQLDQVPKTQGNGPCTLEILMLDHQLSYLSAYAEILLGPTTSTCCFFTQPLG